MNAAKVAAALNTLSVGLGELAEALIEQPERAEHRAPPPGAVPSAPADIVDVPAAVFLEGHEAICPAHHKPFKEGKFGPFCPEAGSEPAWTNSRGYCTVTPKNAAVYLRAHAA